LQKRVFQDCQHAVCHVGEILDYALTVGIALCVFVLYEHLEEVNEYLIGIAGHSEGLSSSGKLTLYLFGTAA
jgi:hypothetical protein